MSRLWLLPPAPIIIHCHETVGGQFIDVGLMEKLLINYSPRTVPAFPERHPMTPW